MNAESRRLATWALVGTLAAVSPAAAHDAPFSYLDLHLAGGRVSGTLVVHAIDAAQTLGIEDPRVLLDPEVATRVGDPLHEAIDSRVQVHADGTRPVPAWSSPVPVPEQDALRMSVRFEAPLVPTVLRIEGCLFAYDPRHQTFVNVYEDGHLATQAILTCARPTLEHFAGTRQGVIAVVRKFLPSGIHHILLGPDHLLFLVGLLLVGASTVQLVTLVSAFTLAHSITLSVAALGLFTPPAHLVEPAIALSIVYVGADNLLGAGTRDVRVWIALGFGLIHGFGFAYVLQDMGLPGRALGWSLLAFNLGVELGQLAVILPVAVAVSALRARSEVAGWWLARGGSLAVMGVGAFWFLERVVS